MSSTNEFVAEAIDNTLTFLPDYAAKTLLQRNPGPQACGSVWDSSHTWEELKAAQWFEKASLEDWQSNCHYFEASHLGGIVGVVELFNLDPKTTVVLDDRKDTGKVSCVVKRSKLEKYQLHHSEYTILITGEDYGHIVVFTVHPGDPVRPSQVTTKPGMHGKSITVSEALELGLTTAKLDWSGYDWS